MLNAGQAHSNVVLLSYLGLEVLVLGMGKLTFCSSSG